MKKLEFKLPLNKTEKATAIGAIDAMRAALAAIAPAEEEVTKILRIKEKVDAKVSKLEEGDGTDDKACAELSATLTQQRQLERTLALGQHKIDAAVKDFRNTITLATQFLSDHGNRLMGMLRDEWADAVLPFYIAGEAYDSRALEFMFNSSHAHDFLSHFINSMSWMEAENLDEMRAVMEGKIKLLSSLVEGGIFWAFDRATSPRKEPLVRYIHPMQQAVESGELQVGSVPVSS